MVRNRTNEVKGSDAAVESTGDADTNVLFEVWLASRAATDVLDRAVAPTGLTADEFAVYSLLVSGPATPSELARWMAAPPTTVSSYVKRFEARGHVLREPNPHDRRSYRVRLTAAGRRIHRRAGVRFLPVLEDVSRSLGDSEDGVRASLGELRTALDAARTNVGE